MKNIRRFQAWKGLILVYHSAAKSGSNLDNRRLFGMMHESSADLSDLRGFRGRGIALVPHRGQVTDKGGRDDHISFLRIRSIHHTSWPSYIHKDCFHAASIYGGGEYKHMYECRHWVIPSDSSLRPHTTLRTAHFFCERPRRSVQASTIHFCSLLSSHIP